MKKNKILILLLFLLSLSCSKKNETEITPLKNDLSLVKDTVYEITDRAFVNMIVCDSFLIFISSKDSCYFHVHNIKTMAPVIKFGVAGNAEFEFRNYPRLVKKDYTSSTALESIDLFTLKKINIIDILQGGDIINGITGERLEDDLTFSRDIAYLDSNRVVGTSLSMSKGLFYIYNKVTKEKRWIDYQPKYRIEKKYCDMLYYGLIGTNQNKKRIFFCSTLFRSNNILR
jgi:hypothetical protein